jgi:hypothetical protein
MTLSFDIFVSFVSQLYYHIIFLCIGRGPLVVHAAASARLPSRVLGRLRRLHPLPGRFQRVLQSASSVGPLHYRQHLRSGANVIKLFLSSLPTERENKLERLSLPVLIYAVSTVFALVWHQTSKCCWKG